VAESQRKTTTPAAAINSSLILPEKTRLEMKENREQQHKKRGKENYGRGGVKGRVGRSELFN